MASDPDQKKSEFEGDLCVMTQRIGRTFVLVSDKDWIASSFGNLLKDIVFLSKVYWKTDWLKTLRNLRKFRKMARSFTQLSNSLFSCLPCLMFNIVNPFSSLSNSLIFLYLVKKKVNNVLVKTNLTQRCQLPSTDFCNLKMAFFLPVSSVATQKSKLGLINCW